MKEDVVRMSHIIKLPLLIIVCACSATVNAAAFPPIIDARVSQVDNIENTTPNIIVSEGSYVDLFEIDDIDDDGIRDHLFQLYDINIGYETDEELMAEECPSVYLAASSVVGSSFVPSDAVEIVGFETLYAEYYNSYGCLSYYQVQPEIIPDLNNDQVNELLFYAEFAYFGDDSETQNSILLFGSIEKGAVIDIAKAKIGDGGFAMAPNLYLQNSLGDLNGDGFTDPLIVHYQDFYDVDYIAPTVRVVSGAAIASATDLSIDAFSGENVLIDFEDTEISNLTGSVDFNGDSFDDLIVSGYRDNVGFGSYVLYGASDLQLSVRGDSPDAALFETDVCDGICELSLAGDFNADGFDDVFLNGFGVNGSEIGGGLIAYGGSDGLPRSVDPARSTRLSYSDSSGYSYYLRANGDINGDGASDLYFENYDGLDFVLLGKKARDPADIFLDQLNGENGFQIVPSDDARYFYWSMRDVNNDGIDDIAEEFGSAVMLLGRSDSDKPLGVQGLSVATGHTMTFLSWSAPDAATAGRVNIYVNENLIDSIDAGATYYQFSQPAPDSTAILKLQYVNNENQTSPELEVPLSNRFQALRQLRATVYSKNSVELFWDSEPSDYIVWRNGSVLAQVSGNSYFDSDVQAGVEYRYHVTQGANAAGLALGRSTTLPAISYYSGCIDYCGDYDDYDIYGYYYYNDECLYTGVIDDRPSAYRSVYPASTDQLLVTTDTNGVEFSTPAIERVESCTTTNEFRTISGGYQQYSATAAELFWERANHISGVVSYEVSLFDEVLSTVDATSYFIDNLGDQSFYEYKVTAIAGDGSRSIPTLYSIYLPENDQHNIEPVNRPPSAVEVRAEVYSSTAAELFWLMEYDNIGNPVAYEVLRNGEVVFVGDAQSYFDDTLQPATTYNFEVLAITDAGLVSEVATVIEVSTPSDGGFDGSAQAEGVFPTGARGAVYSNSALELFWDRPTDITTRRYLIYRNAELVGETDGITFYESGLSANTEYRYSIQATDNDGRFIGDAALVLVKTAQ